jgi:16S rRNA (uracil1498-N3)-methyltransferase
VWLLDPHEGPSLAEAWAAARYAARSSKAESPATLTLLSGPEGGLSPAEAARARGAGAIPVRLGPRVLRAETAPLAAMAALAALLDAASSPPLESA